MAEYGGSSPDAGSGAFSGGGGAMAINTSNKVVERIKSLTYSATVNKLLLDVEADAT